MFARRLVGQGNILNISLQKSPTLGKKPVIALKFVLPRISSHDYCYSNENKNSEGRIPHESFLIKATFQECRMKNSATTKKLGIRKMTDQNYQATKAFFKVISNETSRNTAYRSFSNRSSSKDSTSKVERKAALSSASSKLEEKDINEEKESRSDSEAPFLHFQQSNPVSLQESKDAKDAYRFIQRRQRNNVEQARAKTAANVRRALTGNTIICVAKFGAWLSSGSSCMLSEFIHSVVDCGNQTLLLVGLRDSRNVADRKHPYGYGKSIYFWALVSALGTFFLGAGVSLGHAVGELMEPSLHDITWQVWGVLGLSLSVDGYVFGVTIKEIAEKKPKDKTLWAHVSNLRDPVTLAILLEDGAACLGILIALAGISATHATGMPVFDGLAGVGISGLLAGVGLVLVRVNHRFLLGQAVDRDITEDIERILRRQRSIDNVQSVQSQWTSSETFSYKAEVDFDGTFLAAKLMPRYQHEFVQVKDSLDEELRVLLSWYAEDVIRTVEREVRHIESEIRKEYPGAEYIELEPMSKDADRFAIDDGMQGQLRRIELEALNRYLISLHHSPSDKKRKGKDTRQDDIKPDKK